jgi:hypothetical protein
MMSEFRRDLMETTPLTFQVAFRGADGIVIASDTKLVMHDDIRSIHTRARLRSTQNTHESARGRGQMSRKLMQRSSGRKPRQAKCIVIRPRLKLSKICGEAWKKHFGEEHTPYARVQARRTLTSACRDELRFWHFDVRPDDLLPSMASCQGMPYIRLAWSFPS